MFKKILFVFGLVCIAVPFDVFAATEVVEEVVEETVTKKTSDEIAAEALEAYDVEGSLFEKITNLEQDKMIMKLEAERIRLEMELDTLNAQKMKKQMELDDMYNQSEQQQDFQAAKEELEIQISTLKKQIAEIANKTEKEERKEEKKEAKEEKVTKKEETTPQISGKYKLINVIGIGNQLQATIQDISTGQNKRIAVGKQLNGYTVKSISLNDGIVFEKDGESENLTVGK